MVTFQVPDMTCGHCASTITKAVVGIDKTAHIEVDIPRKLVRVTSAASTAGLAKAIQEVGYTPQEFKAAPATSPAAPRASGGCCCGLRKAASVDAGQPPAAARTSSCS